MEFNESVQLTKALLVILLVTFCSATDLAVRRIPNVVLLPALATALFLNSVSGGVWGLLDSLCGLVIGLLMLMPLHVLGRMGAGDIKLLAVVGSILGSWGAILAGLATMAAGGILALTYVLWLVTKPAVIAKIPQVVHRAMGITPTPIDGMTWRTVGAAEIPYAIAIAAGTFATLAYLQILTEAGVK
jgi:prepilin peptidase CpaA